MKINMKKLLRNLFLKRYNFSESSKKEGILFSKLDDDTEVSGILKREYKRQLSSLELIASENFTSMAVLQANGTIFTNKYSEGYPGKRYYGGNEYIDELEILCKRRALKVFGVNEDEWDVNVQSYSGSTANFSVYTGLLKPGEKIMGLDLPSGGHLTHGYKTEKRKISNSSIYFDSMPYVINKDTFLIDYDDLEKRAMEFKPKMIIVGASAYSRDYDYGRFREIADMNGSYLMADISHTSGLVASDLLRSPFDYCDIVTTTTHKTLRGPRAALIFYKKVYKDMVDFAVFPSSQGGPHNNTIAAVTVALGQALTDEFKIYSEYVINNARCLSKCLVDKGFDILTGGTDNHIVMINLKNMGLTGSKFESLAELCNVSVNKNTIVTDKSALSPSGIRLGTSAMTSRGFMERDMEFVADILYKITELAKKINLSLQKKGKNSKLKEFLDEAIFFKEDVETIANEVKRYCIKFPLPGNN